MKKKLTLEEQRDKQAKTIAYIVLGVVITLIIIIVMFG